MDNYEEPYNRDRISRYIATMMIYKKCGSGTTRLCIIIHFKEALPSDAWGHSSPQESVAIREVARRSENGAVLVFAKTCHRFSNGFTANVTAKDLLVTMSCF